MKRIYHYTDQTDEMIRLAYADPKYRKKQGQAVFQSIAARLGWPRRVIQRRATYLGVTMPMKAQSPWTDAEMKLLEKNGHKNIRVIARLFKRHGYHRTESAIAIRLKRKLNGQRKMRIDAGYLTGRQAAVCLGINEKTVGRYISLGWLPAQHQGTARTPAQGGDFYLIREKDLRAFIIGYTAHLHFGRIDKYWLVDLLTGRSVEKA